MLKGDYFVKNEEINTRSANMIVLDAHLDNFYAFKNFHINFTYPKKIVGSSISEEYLPNRPNFRYKKVNIILGANASGKTTFGRILMKIFNFIDKANFNIITDAICDPLKEASFSLDLASQNNIFYRIVCVIEPRNEEEYKSENIKIQILKTNITQKDSYESCVKKIEQYPFEPAQNYMEELKRVENLAWFFDYPENSKSVDLPNKDAKFRMILENTLKSLDPSIKNVKISKDAKNAYVINTNDKSIVVQNNVVLDTNILSSGTKSGIAVSRMIYSLMQRLNSFYYCDEKFSYIHSDIEKAVLSLMIEFVGPYDQLFFTTHNTDILDMNLPKHSFVFFHKDITNAEFPITCINASTLLKRSTDSLRNAVENDLFSVAPSVELIYSIADLNDGE